MTEDSNPRFIRAVEDAAPEPDTKETDELRTRLKAVEQKLRKERHSSREASKALDALKDDRNLLAVRLHGEELTVEELHAERSETAAKLKSLEQELRLAWHKVETLEALLRWERRPLHRRAFGRRPDEE